MTTDNRTNEELAERLRQFAESQAMDFDSQYTAMMLNEVADRLAGDLIQELIDLRASPVLPSSTVDESNSPTLAVIAKAREFDLSVGMTAAAHMADAAIGASGLRVDLAAPVLPSSTVDEGKIAEVISSANMDYNLSDRSGESYACGAPDYRSAFIARAVVEAIGGETPSKTA